MFDNIDIITIRALAHKLGDSISASLRRAFLLLTILKQYLFDLKEHRKSIENMDGFIVRTTGELSFLTGISDRCIPDDLQFLKERGLLEYGKSSGYRIKVDTDYLLNFIEEAKDDYDKDRRDFFFERHEKKESAKSKRQNKRAFNENLLVGFNKTDLGFLIDEYGEPEGWFIYLFSHYYKMYTGTEYGWDITKRNTMIKVWMDGFKKDYPEYALSRAIKKSLEDRGKRFFELKWRDYFNADSDEHYDGVLFDRLM